jgi:hypothetical protein
MSKEKYFKLSNEEVSALQNEDWFYKESFLVGTAWMVPESRLLKFIDKKKYWHDKMQELIDDFSFNEVEAVMEVLGWTWAGVSGYPKKEDMIPVVWSLYSSIQNGILKGEYRRAATGGFKLTFLPGEEELSLVFESVTGSVYGN